MKDSSPSVGTLLLMNHSQNVPAPLQKRFMDLYRQGDHQQARQEAESLAQRYPQDAFSWKALGNSQLQTGDAAGALSSLEQARTLTPADPLVLTALAKAYFKQGQKERAFDLQTRSLEIDGDSAQAHFNMANMCYEIGAYPRAEKHLAQAEKAGHPEAEVLAMRSILFSLHFEFQKGLEALERLHTLKPEDPSVLNTLGNYHKDMTDFAAAERYYAQALRLSPQYYTAYSNGLLNDHYNPTASAEGILAKSKAWKDHFTPPRLLSHDAKDRTADRPLKVGLLSSNLRVHPVGWMVSSALENLASDIELYAYTDNDAHDPIAEKIKRRCHWVPSYHLSHQQLADRIVADDIDILIDLAGHGAQSRLPVVDMKPAPIIIKWVGMQISSMGMAAFDYFLSDPYETPPGVDHLYTEKLIRLPNDYICYTPPAYTPAITSLPAISNGYVTFGCFNNPAKVNDVMLAEWAKLMHQVPGSRLFLKGGQYTSPDVCQRILSTLEHHGIESERVLLEGPSDHETLLKSYNRVDIALDTWPYSGGLTTCEALLMGVPVVTHAGPTFAGRHSATHLSNTGMPELVTDSWEAFRERVVELASDLPSLAVIRAALRTYLEHSPICDAPKFGRHLRKALRAVWQRYCESAEPAALTFDGHGRAYFEDRDEPVEVPRPPILETDDGFGWPLEEPLIAIDNGGQLLNDENVEKLLRDERLELIVFDPSADAAHHPMSRAERVHYYAGHGLGTGSPATLFTPSPNAPSPLPREQRQGQVATEPSAFDTLALDSIEGLPALDWLVLDDTSDAADILSHGSRSLAAALLIQVKITFQPTHERQPDLGEIQRWAKEHGFRLYHLHDQQHRSALPMDEIHADVAASELWSAQALLLPDQTRMASLSDSQRIKLAFLLHVIYGFKDASGSLLHHLDAALARRYLDRFLSSESDALQAESHATQGEPTPRQTIDMAPDDVQRRPLEHLRSALGHRKLCLIDTGNQANHGIIKRGMHGMFRTLQGAGCPVEWVNADNIGPKTILNLATSADHVLLGGNRYFDFSLNISGYGSSNVFHSYGHPIIGAVNDHPYADFMLDRMRHASPSGLFVARASLSSELAFVRPDISFIFSPTTESSPEAWEGGDRPHRERDIDILVPMNLSYAPRADVLYNDLLDKATDYGDDYVKLVNEVLEQFTDFSRPLLSVFRDAYQRIFGYEWQVYYPWSEEDERLLGLLSLIDDVSRGRARLKAIEVLAQMPSSANIVVLAPEVARQVLGRFVGIDAIRHWQFIGEKTFDELQALYTQARYVLNVSPTYHDWLHERIRHAAISGCAILSNLTQRADQFFNQGQDILFFERTSQGAIYSKDPRHSESLGFAARDKVMTQLPSEKETFANAIDAYADYLERFDSQLTGTGGLENRQQALKLPDAPFMSGAEKALFRDALRSAHSYFEFGSGGSTVWAIENGLVVEGVESDGKWIDALKAKLGEKCRLTYIDIGPTGAWGFPTSNAAIENYGNYSRHILNFAATFDLTLIDGRFRVACVVATVIHIMNTADDISKPRIFIHDFWNRPHYHIVLDYLQPLRRVDTAGLFSVRPGLAIEELEKRLAEYLNDPR
ncbi:tetratricopeptide repeat protein [Salinicola sp. DM10]|uniref:O-linked N-acetylglucosamine transferase, SPINDLY family protein n=1 Tax=Salinicola sp. DM10 TaxID=2815721 RepID=UPI001ACAA125|nr:tetratricopeptide repeat protein [Salinicola sp. DM10]MCE3025833.1 tetratricopeptide repeat protein [Salinicola sp. DM10]